MTDASNQLLCPRCGEVKVQTPPGTTALPTIGLARKAAGAGECDCGRNPGGRGFGQGLEHREGLEHEHSKHPEHEHSKHDEHPTATEEAP